MPRRRSRARSARSPGLPKVGYLGPAGTFSEEALLASALADSVEPVALATIYDTVLAVRSGAVQWALVPIENSLDGSVTVTLDLLADEHGDLEIVGEVPLSSQALADRRRVARARGDRHGDLPPQGPRPVRALPARASSRTRGSSRRARRPRRCGS